MIFKIIIQDSRFAFLYNCFDENSTFSKFVENFVTIAELSDLCFILRSLQETCFQKSWLVDIIESVIDTSPLKFPLYVIVSYRSKNCKSSSPQNSTISCLFFCLK